MMTDNRTVKEIIISVEVSHDIWIKQMHDNVLSTIYGRNFIENT
jgi:hypothetical protein